MHSFKMVDTHCHLDFPDFDPDREAVIARANATGVAQIIVPGVSHDSWQRTIACGTKNSACHYALGLHPAFMPEHKEQHLDALETLLSPINTSVQQAIAVGEIGLDFYLKEPDRQRQLSLFDAQLSIAKAANLPVIIHCRKAHDECLQSLRKHDLSGGVIHAFNGSLQQAYKYLELDFVLGFGGMLTFSRSRRLRKLASELPMDAIVLETDAPDMTVAQHRGARNSPEYIHYIAAELASIRGVDEGNVAENTTANARRVFPSLGKNMSDSYEPL